MFIDEHLWSFYAENLCLFRQDRKNCAKFNIRAGFLPLNGVYEYDKMTAWHFPVGDGM